MADSGSSNPKASIGKFSEWGSLYYLSTDTIQALVPEGIDCEEALTGLKEAELDQLKDKHSFNLGQHSLLRALWQLCNSRSRSSKSAAASTVHSSAVESANDAKESLRDLFPAIYRKPQGQSSSGSGTSSSLSSQPSAHAMHFTPKGKQSASNLRRGTKRKSMRQSLPPAKKAAYDRGKVYTIVCLPHEQYISTIPKGKSRDELREKGLLRSLLIFKSMEPQELVQKIHTLFPKVFGESPASDVPLFNFLAADKWNGLNRVENIPLEHWNGESVRELAGSGCIYVQPRVKQEVSQTCMYPHF